MLMSLGKCRILQSVYAANAAQIDTDILFTFKFEKFFHAIFHKNGKKKVKQSSALSFITSTVLDKRLVVLSLLMSRSRSLHKSKPCTEDGSQSSG